MDNTIIKRCNNCRKKKPVTDFARRDKSTDNVRAVCKVCRAKQCKEYYEAHLTKWDGIYAKGGYVRKSFPKKVKHIVVKPKKVDEDKMFMITAELK